MTPESARPRIFPVSSVKRLPFAEIPGQSRLFLDYLRDPLSLRQYYPNAVASPLEIAGFRDQMLASYTTDRGSLCDALVDINTVAGAGRETLANIQLLRGHDTAAVVTGQQAGLFTGPLYTIYKGLSAIRLADQLRAEGLNVVPVFWIASEDHDLDEIDHAYFLEKSDGLDCVGYRPAQLADAVSVGDIRFDHGIERTIDALTDGLPRTDLSTDLKHRLSASYAAGETYGTAFAKLIISLVGRYGLVIIDPLNETLKELASPLYVAAIERSDEIVNAMRARNNELEAAGYHAQVRVEEGYVPLFWHDDGGRRLALRRTNDGRYRVKGDKTEFTSDDLLRIAKAEPRRFSPGVMVRPVVQDHLLPTLCYVGGGAEIAYFAQNSEAYRVLGRPVTPILHRQSFTIVEPREQRSLKRFGWTLRDLFVGKEAAIMQAAETQLSADIAGLFAEVEKRVNTELDRLDARLSDVDPTIADSLAMRRRKIAYHLTTLKQKTLRSQLAKDETMRRQIDNIFDSLLPYGVLQERELTVVTFLNRYGPSFLDWLYDAVDLADKDHRIIEL